MKWLLSVEQESQKKLNKKYCHGGNIRKFEEDYKLNSGKIIDFSVSLNPLGLSNKVKSSILTTIDSVTHYPDVFYKDLKESIADYIGVKSKNILVGNGSVEFIYIIPRALSIKRALIPIPTFSEYESAVKLNSAGALFIKTYEKENFKIDVDKIVKKLNFVDSIFLCNPNNPTGYLIPKDEILFLIKRCDEKGIYLFIDEVFIEFVDEKYRFSGIKEIKKRKNLLILRSLTKFFNIPGLRIGYLIGNERLIKKIDEFQPPWSVNSIAEDVTKNVLKDFNYINKTKVYIKKERQRFFNELKRIKFLKLFLPPSANFIFCKLKDRTSNELCDKLAKHGIIIRDCSNFRGLNNKYVRFAIRKKEENDKLIKILDKWNY